MTTTTQADLKQRVQEYLEKNPRAMTLEMARQLAIPEANVVRYLPDNRATELDASRFADIMAKCEGMQNVHIIVSNAAATMESTGTLGGFSTSSGYFNIQSDSIDMHIRSGAIASAFAVMKPSHMTGTPTLSLQFFSEAGDSAFKAFLTFGQSEPSPETQKKWEAIRTQFATGKS